MGEISSGVNKLPPGGLTVVPVSQKHATNVRTCCTSVASSGNAGDRAPPGLEACQSGVDATLPTPVWGALLVPLHERIESLQKAGRSSRQIRAQLKYEYGEPYTDTEKAWTNKKRNAKKEGIHVDDSFRDFPLFLKVCGLRPHPSYQIDRKDSDGSYAIGNVWWKPMSDNLKNRGNAPKIREYISLTNKSRSQAYRDLNKNPIMFHEVTGGREAPPNTCGQKERAEWRAACEFIERWEAIHQKTYNSPLKLSRSKPFVLRVIAHLRDHPHATEIIPKVFEYWEAGEIEKRAFSLYAIVTGQRPSVGKLFKHAAELYSVLDEAIQWHADKNREQLYALTRPAVDGIFTPMPFEEKQCQMPFGLRKAEHLARYESLCGEITTLVDDLYHVLRENNYCLGMFEDDLYPATPLESLDIPNGIFEGDDSDAEVLFAKVEAEAPAWRARFREWLPYLVGEEQAERAVAHIMRAVTPTSPPAPA